LHGDPITPDLRNETVDKAMIPCGIMAHENRG
jgi:hypothetical protein